MFLILPYVITISAWGWWWLLWMTLIYKFVMSIDDTSIVGKTIISVITGIALHSPAVLTALAALPGIALFGGWLYPIIFWIICYFAL